MSENNTYNTDTQRQEQSTPGKEYYQPPVYRHRTSQTSIFLGTFLLLVGGLLLLRRLDIEVPDFLVSWQMLLIAIGIFLGIRKGFQGAGWLICILIGTLFLLNEFFVFGELRRFILPIILVGAGLFFIFRPRRQNGKYQTGDPNFPNTPGASAFAEEFIDITSIFGGTKKKVYSKNFKGGDMVNIFGGSEVDLSQADITGNAVIEVTALFGGATIIVPSHWNVVADAVAILGEVKDKRVMTNIPEGEVKTLIIKGSVIFGGVDVKSF
ncbi:MAG: DUF5668 domain-containing protein [Niabella sp.]